MDLLPLLISIQPPWWLHHFETKDPPSSYRLDSSTPPGGKYQLHLRYLHVCTRHVFYSRLLSSKFWIWQICNQKHPWLPPSHFKLAKEASNSDRTELWIFLNRGLMPMMKYASEFLPRTNRVVTRRIPEGLGELGSWSGEVGGWCLCNEWK